MKCSINRAPRFSLFTWANAALFQILLVATIAVHSTGCSMFASRPVQEMSDTAAALTAAKEVSADVASPELYRQAKEWFFYAKREYKLKNFDRAAEFARKARILAELAEFEAMRGGAPRSSEGVGDAFSNSTPPPPPPPPPLPTHEDASPPSTANPEYSGPTVDQIDAEKKAQEETAPPNKK